MRAPRTIFDYSNCCHRNGCDCVLLPVSVELSWRNKDIFFVGHNVLSPTSMLGDTTCDEADWGGGSHFRDEELKELFKLQVVSHCSVFL